MTLDGLLQRLDIGEDQDTEFKEANGGLPKSIWETISAFANTEGGYIILGVKQHNDSLEPVGIKQPTALLKMFWDLHNNRLKLSVTLCTESDAKIITISERKLVIIHIPRAQRSQRPVFINGNPMTGTYKRNYEGDYHCSETEVRQMLRDASDEPQDAKILDHYGLNDLDDDTLKAFRQRLASRDSDHPFLDKDNKALLIQLGAWRRDRASNKEELTLAGLLMFGRERSILDACPYFHLDYQEQLSSDPEIRWTYRLTLDGKWQPNLFNFYYRVYPRLVEGLDVPFKLDKDAVRLGETHVHEALREALVNTLIHADHCFPRPIIVIKRHDEFIFTNPGRLRIPREILYQDGGLSDPRNPNLQKMFQLLGLSEKAGSGFQKMLRAWREQHWLVPLISENPSLEITRVRLPLASMISEEVSKELRNIVGDAYTSLTEQDHIILMLAHQFNEIGNADIQYYLDDHPREIGDQLRHLVKQGWLIQSGHGRGTRYYLPTAEPSSGHYEPSSGHYEPSSGHYEPSSGHYEPSSGHYEQLRFIAAPIRERGRVNKELAKQIILKLCTQDYLSLRTLSEFLNRQSESLRKHYIIPMVAEGLLELRYPDQLNHPQQGYKTIKTT